MDWLRYKELLVAARDYLSDEWHWTKSRFITGDGRVCALGAFYYAGGMRHGEARAHGELHEYAQRFKRDAMARNRLVMTYGGVESWNDRSFIEHQDVLRLYDDIIDYTDERITHEADRGPAHARGERELHPPVNV